MRAGVIQRSVIRAGLAVLVWGGWLSSAQATVMEISFSGQILAVNDKVGDYWEGEDLVGLQVQGRYLLNAASAGLGREETSFYWWWDIDNRPGVMTSEIRFGDRQFTLGGKHDCFEIMGYTQCAAGEFIHLQTDDDPLDDEENIPDLLSLKDREAVMLVEDNATYAENVTELTMGFHDYINDILGPPPLDQAFHWVDGGDGQFGIGTLDLFGWDPDAIDEYTVLWDTEVRFRVDEVTARPAGTGPVGVPEPGTLALLFLGALMMLGLRRRLLTDSATHAINPAACASTSA